MLQNATWIFLLLLDKKIDRRGFFLRQGSGKAPGLTRLALATMAGLSERGARGVGDLQCSRSCFTRKRR